MIKVTDDWNAVDWSRKPLTAGVGPFPHREFLRTWWEHRGSGTLQLVESEKALLPLRRAEGWLEFLGEADLTDYHTPLGSSAGATAGEFLAMQPPGTPFRFDSLPAEVASDMGAEIEGAGCSVATSEFEVAAVLGLPATFDDYLASVGSKQRHEIKRKSRRFREQFGAPRLATKNPTDALRVFVSMHRASAGSKGSFMTDEMAGFFEALLGLSGWAIHLLMGVEDRPLAASFGFETTEAYYLYNSAFDPAARPYSPGIVLVGSLVERAIAEGRRVFDFLKGDEEYKFRMGAMPRPLYLLEGTT